MSRLVRLSVIAVLAILLSSQVSLRLASGQEEETLQAATATPGATNYVFGLLPVGDYPQGYFEDVAVPAGEEIELQVRVINAGTEDVDLRVYKANALSSVNGGFSAGNEADDQMAVTSWLNFPTVELTIEAQSEQVVPFSVSVPLDALPGQYITSLVAETQGTQPIEGNDVLDQKLRFAMTVGIMVPGSIVGSFDIGEPILEGQYLAIPISNTGNVLVRLEGRLTLADENGREILTAPVKMGSIYSGLSTYLAVSLPEQLPPANYVLDLTLVDSESGASGSIEEATVVIAEPEDSTGVSVAAVTIEPNAEEIVFANVDVSLQNGGQRLPASNVTLEVMRDGEQVDSFPLATNQVLLSGENQFVTRYLPADMWQSGEYTFSIKVSAVDPNGGQETVLLDEELDATIVVP